MAKYTKLVQNQAELIALKASNDFITPNVTLIYDNRTIDFNPMPHDYSWDYLTFVAEENGTFGFSGSVDDIQYSVDDGETWITLTNTTTVQAGDKIMWKGELTPSLNGIGTFYSSGRFTAQGNVMSLLYGDNFIGQTSLSGKDRAFHTLFGSCTGITNAINLKLPATTLAEYCYEYMFVSCTSLTTAPELPATTLENFCYNTMFAACTSLTTAPELPATTLTQGCYQMMFQGCTSLTTAPELPATILANNCYQYMFRGCSSLTIAPSLPAMTLASNCYDSMFVACTSLTIAPELPATILAKGCYGSMFYGCTSLTTAPELPATTLTNSCYYGMFQACTGLTTAPSLPATTLSEGCYGSMFSGCTSLTIAPELPATTLVACCYQYMFYGCTNLNNITCLATDISAIDCTNNWVNSVAASGTFTKAASMTGWTTGTSGIPSGWTVQDNNTSPSHDYSLDYFTIEALESGTLNIEITPYNSENTKGYLQYSLDGGETWSEQYGSIEDLSLNANDKLLIKGDITTDYGASGGNSMSYTGDFNVCGNIMSLVYGDNFANQTSLISKDDIFASFFSDNKTLLSAENLILPATILANRCYFNMFLNCSSLTTTPALPATTLAENCYGSMFGGCTLLTTAPELPVTTLANYCYSDMFKGCTSLTTAPELPATTLASNCYNGMFSGCTSLTTAPELSATTLAENCYYGMFDGCTSLTTAPVLPATTLVYECYSYMFYDCTNLNNITCLATDISASYCTDNWVVNVASTGTFTKAASMTGWTTGTSGIPSGWTVQDAS